MHLARWYVRLIGCETGKSIGVLQEKREKRQLERSKRDTRSAFCVYHKGLGEREALVFHLLFVPRQKYLWKIIRYNPFLSVSVPSLPIEERNVLFLSVSAHSLLSRSLLPPSLYMHLLYTSVPLLSDTVAFPSLRTTPPTIDPSSIISASFELGMYSSIERRRDPSRLEEAPWIKIRCPREKCISEIRLRSLISASEVLAWVAENGQRESEHEAS